MISMDLDNPFELGFGVLKNLPRVIYEITATNGREEKKGFGEASIDFPFSNYDAWDIMYALEKTNTAIKGIDVKERESLLGQNFITIYLKRFPAALCAFNMALDDIYGKCEEKTIFDIYGQTRLSGVALKSIGYKTKESLSTKIGEIVREGFIPKPKVGRSLEQDVDIILLVDKRIKELNSQYTLDFNACYSIKEFMELLDALKSKTNLSRCLIIEQPTIKDAGIDGICEVKNYALQEGFKMKFMADESFITIKDAIYCSENGILLNFKLQKIGGLCAAKEIEDELGERNLESMIGGTFPTAIGRTYDQQASCILKSAKLPGDGLLPSQEYFKYQKHLIKEDFQKKVSNGKKKVTPFSGFGLGINIVEEKLRRFLVSNPKEEYGLIRSNQSGRKIKIILNEGHTYSELYKELSGRSPDWNLNKENENNSI